MLVLSRKLGEELVIGDNIQLKVVAIHGNQVRLGITAPVGIPVRRQELCRSEDRCNCAHFPAVDGAPQSSGRTGPAEIGQ